MKGIGGTTGVIAALVLGTLAAGCGGSSGNQHGSAMTGGRSGGPGMTNGGGGMMPGSTATAPATTSTTVPGGAGAGTAARGRALFVSSGCGSCHALADAGASGTAGPDLDQLRPSYAVVVQSMRDGLGAMPSFTDTLTDAQIRAIARYVADATR